LSWQAECADAEIKALNFGNTVIFNGALDPHLKAVLKGCNGAKDVMVSSKIVDMINEITEALEEELNPGAREAAAVMPMMRKPKCPKPEKKNLSWKSTSEPSRTLLDVLSPSPC
jgi:hypothetical protein